MNRSKQGRYGWENCHCRLAGRSSYRSVPAIGLLWNSMMSWSGGWFFFIAAEIFNVGSRDCRLPGLGALLTNGRQRK
jgi:hypothetical protein